MHTLASIAGHPIHPMLIAVPLCLLTLSLICDLVALFASDPDPWQLAALVTMAGGLPGALAAAVPGAIDLFWLSNLKLKLIGMWQVALNLVVVLLYSVNLWLRYPDGDNAGVPFALSVLAIGILSVSSWLRVDPVCKRRDGAAGPDPPTTMARRE